MKRRSAAGKCGAAFEAQVKKGDEIALWIDEPDGLCDKTYFYEIQSGGWYMAYADAKNHYEAVIRESRWFHPLLLILRVVTAAVFDYLIWKASKEYREKNRKSSLG